MAGTGLPVLPPSFTLIALDTVGSTNDEAVRRAAEGAAHGTVVWAQEQTKGRGRRGRHWHSPRGNLHASVLFRTGRPPFASAQLGFVAALALAEAVAQLLPARSIRCKWPNDLLCDGRKIAGLLLETAGKGAVVIGSGVNVEACPDPALYPATSLRAAGSSAGAAEVLEAYTARLAVWYETWDKMGFEPIRQAWLGRAHGLGGQVEARLADGSILCGAFIDLDADGAMLLDQSGGGHRRVLAGDVFFPAA